MNHKYVTMKTVYPNGARTRKAYGIAVISTLDNVSILHEISDITTERKKLKSLVNLCNRDKLEIEHLQNAIDDFLCK